MQKVSKIFQYLSVVFGAIWFGANLSRTMLTFYLFEGNQFQLKPFINSLFLMPVFYILNPLISLSAITYVVFFISLLIYIATSTLKLKQNGWLFIILVLVVTLAPFELYLTNLDYKIMMSVFYSTFDPKTILDATIARYKVLGSFPLIHLFSFLAVIYLSIFQPLTKNEN